MPIPIVVAIIFGILCLFGSGCSSNPYCGDSMCNGTDTYQNCPQDCSCYGHVAHNPVDRGTQISDTDGGFDPCTGGVISYTDANGNPQTGTDNCSGSGFVDEWHGNPNGDIHRDLVTCANGASCISGGRDGDYCG